jgi:hypothetical protein
VTTEMTGREKKILYEQMTPVKSNRSNPMLSFTALLVDYKDVINILLTFVVHLHLMQLLLSIYIIFMK